jgi:Xaa-Pro aminopeptidase
LEDIYSTAFSNLEMNIMSISPYPSRIDKLCSWMADEKIDAVVIEDAESRRDSSLAYLSGMPSDAVLIIFADGESVLLPWDEILAGKLASADKIIGYSEYERSYVKAVSQLCSEKLSSGRIELSSQTPHLLYSEIAGSLTGFEIVCRIDGLREKLLQMRAVKDENEIEIYREGGKLTNRMIDAICDGFKSGTIKTELDAALFIEAESRRLGAEGPSFETLAAGASRSWGIHAVPSYTAGPIGNFAQEASGGLSIIDCGLKYKGYCTDITLTICRGTLDNKQEEMVSLVQEAHKIAAEAAVSGIHAAKLARIVDEHFAVSGYAMPHGLGHGVGLDVHEEPGIKDKDLYDKPILPGMIFTIEPGLYNAVAGGVRLEDDFLMTENGAVALTSSRILRLP